MKGKRKRLKRRNIMSRFVVNFFFRKRENEVVREKEKWHEIRNGAFRCWRGKILLFQLIRISKFQ